MMPKFSGVQITPLFLNWCQKTFYYLKSYVHRHQINSVLKSYSQVATLLFLRNL
jgi:hypothetical protein